MFPITRLNSSKVKMPETVTSIGSIGEPEGYKYSCQSINAFFVSTLSASIRMYVLCIEPIRLQFIWFWILALKLVFCGNRSVSSTLCASVA